MGEFWESNLKNADLFPTCDCLLNLRIWQSFKPNNSGVQKQQSPEQSLAHCFRLDVFIGQVSESLPLFTYNRFSGLMRICTDIFSLICFSITWNFVASLGEKF